MGQISISASLHTQDIPLQVISMHSTRSISFIKLNQILGVPLAKLLLYSAINSQCHSSIHLKNVKISIQKAAKTKSWLWWTNAKIIWCNMSGYLKKNVLSWYLRKNFSWWFALSWRLYIPFNSRILSLWKSLHQTVLAIKNGKFCHKNKLQLYCIFSRVACNSRHSKLTKKPMEEAEQLKYLRTTLTEKENFNTRDKN